MLHRRPAGSFFQKVPHINLSFAIFFASALLLSAVISVIGLKTSLLYRELCINGTVTVGTVVSVESRKGLRGGVVWYSRYAYTDFKGRSCLSETSMRRFRKGDTLYVTYSPEDTGRNVPFIIRTDDVWKPFLKSFKFCFSLISLIALFGLAVHYIIDRTENSDREIRHERK